MDEFSKQVTPILAIDNVANGRLGHAILLTDGRLSGATGSILSTDSDNLLRSKFTRGFFTVSVSALRHHVRLISLPVASKQMGGIDTGWVVTVVANKHARSKWAIRQFKRKAMGFKGVITNTKVAVVVFISRPYPGPASIGAAGLVYKGPKTLRGWSLARRVVTSWTTVFPATALYLATLGNKSPAAVYADALNLRTGTAMPFAVTDVLPFNPTKLGVRLGGNSGGTTTAAEAQTEGIRYTVHAETSNTGSRPRSGVFPHRLGIFMPNYTLREAVLPC